MWDLPTNRNYIIQYAVGDGFRSELPHLLTGQHLYLGHRRTINLMKQHPTQCVEFTTVHRLARLLEGKCPQTCLVLDARIPSAGSKAYWKLLQLCEGRNLIILHPPLTDVESINSLLTLISVTKNKVINVKKWNQFMYQRRM